MQFLRALGVVRSRVLGCQVRCYAKISAYSAYVKEAMKTPSIQSVPQRERLAAIGAMWKKASPETKEQWKAYAAKLSDVAEPKEEVAKARKAAPKPAANKKEAKTTTKAAPKAARAVAKPKAGAKPKNAAKPKAAAKRKPKATTKAKSKAAPKPSTAPAKPVKKLSAYQVFMKSAFARPDIKALPGRQRMSAVGKMWKGLSAEEKKPYIEQALATQPEKPKKVVTAYTLFTKEAHTRADLKAVPFTQRSKRIAQLWKGMTAEQQKPYRDQASATAPRKKVSGYQLFVRETYRRPEVQAFPFEKRLQKISELWKALPEKEKKPFVDRAVELSPPRPAKRVGAMALFVKAAYKRPEIQALPFTQRLGKIAELWKGMPAQEKEPYLLQSQQLSLNAAAPPK